MYKGAEAADKLEYGNYTWSSIAAAGSKPAESASSNGTQFSQAVSKLDERNSHSKHYREYCSRSTSRYRQTRSHSHAHASTSTSKFCYYHYRFGAYARKCRNPCSFKILGKREQGTEVASSDSSSWKKSRRLFIANKKRGRIILINTGAEVTVFPPNLSEIVCPREVVAFNVTNNTYKNSKVW